jgi:hypothetical protein
VNALKRRFEQEATEIREKELNRNDAKDAKEDALRRHGEHGESR